MGKSHGCLDRNIMLGEQAREERRGRRGRDGALGGQEYDMDGIVLNGGGWVPYAQWPHPV